MKIRSSSGFLRIKDGQEPGIREQHAAELGKLHFHAGQSSWYMVAAGRGLMGTIARCRIGPWRQSDGCYPHSY